jgi:phospholipase/carboxylesterase
MERGPGRESEADIRQAAEQVEALIAREHERGVPSERIVLAGFSQGAAMALHVGLRHPRRLAGIMALSGYLLLEDTLLDEHSDANNDTPLFCGHGRGDDVVPMAMGRHAFDVPAQGRPAEWRDYPMGHELCHDELRDLKAWLHASLA